MSTTENKTPIEFVLLTLEQYLDEIIKPAYQQPHGLKQHHLLILTKHKLYKPFIFAQTELSPVMINAVMQDLTRLESVIAYILFADGFELDTPDEINPQARIMLHPDRKRVLKVNTYIKEGALCRTYQVGIDEKYKCQVLEGKDYWMKPEEPIYGFSNPFFKKDCIDKLPKEELEKVSGTIQKTLKAHIKRHKDKDMKIEHEIETDENQ
ncbi:Conserved_hypothetical protein [Hexamita inflata]|uniref:Uncharacterized protein n=1 Tax=Hexamita inflata TaxID=28002 RepID=A0ABP1GDV3_9EUKA